MVEDFADVALVEVEVSVAEVDKGDTSDKDQQPRVVSLTCRFERIVTDLVTVGHIVDPGLFLPGGGASVAVERMHMAIRFRNKKQC